MKKLSTIDEKKALKALEKCAAATKDIKDSVALNDKVYELLKKEGLADKPELLKRACEAYNSAKTIYIFSNTTDDSRGDTFALIDAPELYKRACAEAASEYIDKVASVNGVSRISFYKNEKPMQKAASEKPVAKTEQPVQSPVREPSAYEVNNILNDTISVLTTGINKAASDVQKYEAELERISNIFADTLAAESAPVRKQAAELIHKNMGLIGDAIIERFNEKKPMAKIASYDKNKYKGSVRLPETFLYKKANELVDTYIMYKRASDKLDMVIKETVDASKKMLGAYQYIHKKAFLEPTRVMESALGQRVDQTLGELLSLSNPDDAAARSSITTQDLVNSLRALGVRRAFIDTINDDTISKYPLDKIIEAYNNVLTELPMNMRDIPATGSNALIKARVIARLGRGSAPAQSDADEARNNLLAFAKIDDRYKSAAQKYIKR